MTTLADSAARTRIADDLDATLVVEAAAGTGKTTALVGRMIAVLTAGAATLDRMVAVTFTELAAGELKLRLRTEIERRREACAPDSVEHRRLVAALPQLEEARIGTIHSFCSDLLRERPVEAGVDPLFEVAAEDLSGDFFSRAFDQWFERALAEPGEGLRRMLRRGSRERGGPRALLRNAAWELARWRDFPAPWRHQTFDRSAAIDAILVDMTALAAEATGRNPDDYFTKSLTEIAHFVDEVARREAVRERDYDGLEADLIQLPRARHWRWTGFTRGADAAWKQPVRPQREALHAALVQFADTAGAHLAPHLRDELWPVVERYEALKISAGRLDFLDLLLLARDLLLAHPSVRHDLQARFTHLFVDEFQDTDPLQAEILLLLAAADPAATDWTTVRPIPGKLFLVGDPKQSIYRFRRADVALYETIKRRLVAAGAVVEHLTTSFRAVPDIQQAVNAALAPRMTGSAGQATYVPLTPFRKEIETQPAVVALPVPAPYGDYGKIVDWRINESLPDATAAFVDWLVRKSGWTVTERERPDERVPVEPRHVCLLFRRFRSFGNDVTHPYVRALEARQLPHVLVGGSAFHAREEVEAVRNALTAIERPEDELAVFATLRGPLFALGDGALLAYQAACGTFHAFRQPPDELAGSLAEVAAALAVLRDLHRGRNRRPIAATISRLLEATRAHAGLAIWPTGEQALANVTRLMDLARRAERSGVTSFRRFVERLGEGAEQGGTSDAPIIEEGTGGVRLMTVHRAKGLEFPVVVLADITAKEAPTEPQRFVDPEGHLCAMRLAGCAPPELLEQREEEHEREREEATRVLYVAATRARDLLVVPTLGDERREGWLGALNPAVYPSEADRRAPVAVDAPGCPPFKSDSVAVRPDRAPGSAHAVAPGVHDPECGEHQVVWWDPTTLELSVEERVGLRQQMLLAADEKGERSEEGVRAHAAWLADQQRVRAQACRASVDVTTATEWAHAHADDPAPSDVIVDEVPGRTASVPRGARFGTLVHAVLAAVDLEADQAGVEQVVRQQGRLLGAPAAERDAAVERVVRALHAPLLRRAATAARAGLLRREVPVAFRLDDARLVEGVVDLAFRDPDDENAWTVVDFKTDYDLDPHIATYRWQIDIYARAIAAATGAPTRSVLLRV